MIALLAQLGDASVGQRTGAVDPQKLLRVPVASGLDSPRLDAAALAYTSASSAPGFEAVAKSQTLGRLAKATTYHFRVVATNANGVSVSGEKTFTTGSKVAGGAA